MLRKRKNLRLQLLFMGGIVGGTAVGIWLHDWLTEQMILSRTLFFLQISKAELQNITYLKYLLRIRAVQIAILFFFFFRGWYEKILMGLCLCAGVWSGLYLTGYTLLDGLGGFVLFGANILPQALLYGFGCMLLYEFSGKRDRFRPAEQTLIFAQIAGIFFLGIAGEYWLQPQILDWVYKTMI